jgi:DNA-binding XRE family transcriptional regulator
MGILDAQETMSTTIAIDGRHISAARDLLKMTQDDLAAAAGVSKDTIWNIENHRTVPRKGSLEKIREALERRGIEFTNGNSPGVKLRPEKAIIPV